MSTENLHHVRSLLFVPASNERALEKARELAADLVIVDLEDSVKDADKAGAREAAIAATQAGFGDRPVAIRINATGSPYYGEDVVALRRSRVDYVVLAKAESGKQVADATWLTGKPVMAMLETAHGVMNAETIAPAARALIAGTNDLALDLGLPPGAGRRGLTFCLQRIVLAARSSGAAVFDGVHNRLDSVDELRAECEEGRDFGFDGKSVIHPGQIEVVNRQFSPSAAEVESARSLIEAATGGAERHEGRMIEQLHVEQARRVLARARARPEVRGESLASEERPS